MTNLFLKFSDYSITGPFRRKKLSAASLAVMEEFESAEELAEMSVERLIDFLVKHCYIPLPSHKKGKIFFWVHGFRTILRFIMQKKGPLFWDL
ncbi:hypothetical protein [Thermicanus aegyptius]|uniref:hypothetical protein n=1 Tax=Thermicanus aegyptius TaxID=94009 RepID=UPI0004100F3F|nr:hypothetical protein [Thermicanus aegyptius]